jgi:hypothetical protein
MTSAPTARLIAAFVLTLLVLPVVPPTRVGAQSPAMDGRPVARTGPARVNVFQGETYDFEYESSADVLHVRIKVPGAAAGVDDVSLQLRARP